MFTAETVTSTLGFISSGVAGLSTLIWVAINIAWK